MMGAENVRLGEICTIQYGFAFNSKKFGFVGVYGIQIRGIYYI